MFRHIAFLGCSIVFVGCADSISHCIYGLPDSVMKVDAEVCSSKIHAYEKRDQYWHSKNPIDSKCDGFDVFVTFDDNRRISTGGIYSTSMGEKITVFQQYEMRENFELTLLNHRMDFDGIKKCVAEGQVGFTHQCTNGECTEIQHVVK